MSFFLPNFLPSGAREEILGPRDKEVRPSQIILSCEYAPLFRGLGDSALSASLEAAAAFIQADPEAALRQYEERVRLASGSAAS